MNNNNPVYKKRRVQRMNNVDIVYKYELFNELLDVNKIFAEDNVNNDQLKILISIKKNHNKFIQTAKLFLDDDWTWLRISPLTRAIILCASVELWTLDKKIVINEYVEISKDYIPDETYKFVNKILDKIGRLYEQNKLKNN